LSTSLNPLVTTPKRVAKQRSPRPRGNRIVNIYLYSLFHVLTNSLPKALLDKIGSRRIELVIDQPLYFFYKLLCVRLADMIIECGLIYPARVNVEQTRIPNRAKRMNAQTTSFQSRRRNHLTQCSVNSSFLTGASVKPCKDE